MFIGIIADPFTKRSSFLNRKHSVFFIQLFACCACRWEFLFCT